MSEITERAARNTGCERPVFQTTRELCGKTLLTDHLCGSVQSGAWIITASPGTNA